MGHVYDKYCEPRDFITRRRNFPEEHLFEINPFIDALQAPKIVAQIQSMAERPRAATHHRADALLRIKDLSDTLDGVRTSVAFCCGGTVAIPTARDCNLKSDFQAGLQDDVEPLLLGSQIAGTSTSGPAIVDWEDMSTNTTHKLAFSGGTTVGDTEALECLLSSTSPATFGRGGLDVLDLSRRKAMKLEPAQYTTNFHPANHGILDDVRESR